LQPPCCHRALTEPPPVTLFCAFDEKTVRPTAAGIAILERWSGSDEDLLAVFDLKVDKARRSARLTFNGG
jgi:hypothetical protein